MKKKLNNFLIIFLFIINLMITMILPFVNFSIYQNNSYSSQNNQISPIDGYNLFNLANDSQITIEDWEDGIHNFTLNNDGVLELNQTRHYIGNESFINYDAGSYGRFYPPLPNWRIYFNSPAYTGVGIVDEIQSHKKVMCLWDSQSDGIALAAHSCGNSGSNGSAEFFIMWTNTTQRSYITLRQGISGAPSIYCKIENQTLFYNNESVYNSSNFSIIKNIWYHFKIDFDYNLMKFNISIDSTQIIYSSNIISTTSYFNEIEFLTGSSDHTSFYIDALDYSWANNYEEGRWDPKIIQGNYIENFIEEFYTINNLTITNQSYEFTDINLYFKNQTGNWMEYVNQGIVNLINGSYKIELKSSNFLYSPKVYSIVFNYPYIEDNYYFTENVDNKIVLNSTGHFFTNESFTSYSSGNFITQSHPRWDLNSAGGGSSITILSELDNHKNVLRLYDTFEYNDHIASLDLENVDNGNVTFFWRTDNALLQNYFTMSDGSLSGIRLMIGNGYFNYYNETGYESFEPALANQWYFMKIVFNFSIMKYDVYINNSKLLSGINITEGSYINQLSWFTMVWNQYPNWYSSYIDAIDLSWDPNYFEDRYMTIFNGTYTKDFQQNEKRVYNAFVDSNINENTSFTLQIRNKSQNWINFDNKSYYLVDGQWRIVLNTTDYLDTPVINSILFNNFYSWEGGDLNNIKITNNILTLNQTGKLFGNVGTYTRKFLNFEFFLYNISLDYKISSETSILFQIRNSSGNWIEYSNDPVYLIDGEWKLTLTSNVIFSSPEIYSIDFNVIEKSDFSFNSSNWNEGVHNYTENNNGALELNTGNLIANESFNNGLGNWEIETESGYGDAGATISTNVGGYKNVLSIYKEGYWRQVWARNYFSNNRTNGTISFWWREELNQVSSRSHIFQLNNSNNSNQRSAYLRAWDGNFQALNGSTWETIQSNQKQTWYYIKITFECENGSYDGLSNDTYNVYIDGEKYGPFNFEQDENYTNSIVFGLYRDASGWITDCWDAIDYSWESDYYEERNRYIYNGTYTSQFNSSIFGDKLILHDVNIHSSSNQTTSILFQVRNKTSGWMNFPRTSYFDMNGLESKELSFLRNYYDDEAFSNKFNKIKYNKISIFNGEWRLILNTTENNLISPIVNYITFDYDILFNSSKYKNFKGVLFQEKSGISREDEIIHQFFSFENGTNFEDTLHVVDESGKEVLSQVWNISTFANDTFSSDQSWADPYGWSCHQPGNTDVRINPNIYGRNNVLELKDHLNGSGKDYFSWAQKSIPNRENGTIEFWARKNIECPALYFVAIGDGGLSQCIGHILPVTDDWTHFRITFECNYGGYDGLTEETYNIYINGIYDGTYGFTLNSTFEDTYIHTIEFQGYGGVSHAPFECQIDDIDYSWSENWFQGRNKYLANATVSHFADVPANTEKVYRYYYNDMSTTNIVYEDLIFDEMRVEQIYQGSINISNSNGIYASYSYSDSSSLGLNLSDEKGNNWILDGFGKIQPIFSTDFYARVREKGFVFCEVFGYVNNNEYISIRQYDNGLFNIIGKNDIAYNWSITSVNDFNFAKRIIDNYYFYNESSQWEKITVGGTEVFNEVSEGKIFMENESKREFVFIIFNESQQLNMNQSSFSGPSNISIVLGSGDNGELQPNIESDFWIGINQHPNTEANYKQLIIDELYDSFIKNPLTKVLGFLQYQKNQSQLLTYVNYDNTNSTVAFDVLWFGNFVHFNSSAFGINQDGIQDENGYWKMNFSVNSTFDLLEGTYQVNISTDSNIYEIGKNWFIENVTVKKRNIVISVHTINSYREMGTTLNFSINGTVKDISVNKLIENQPLVNISFQGNFYANNSENSGVFNYQDIPYLPYCSDFTFLIFINDSSDFYQNFTIFEPANQSSLKIQQVYQEPLVIYPGKDVKMTYNIFNALNENFKFFNGSLKSLTIENPYYHSIYYKENVLPGYSDSIITLDDRGGLNLSISNVFAGNYVIRLLTFETYDYKSKEALFNIKVMPSNKSNIICEKISQTPLLPDGNTNDRVNLLLRFYNSSNPSITLNNQRIKIEIFRNQSFLQTISNIYTNNSGFYGLSFNLQGNGNYNIRVTTFSSSSYLPSITNHSINTQSKAIVNSTYSYLPSSIIPGKNVNCSFELFNATNPLIKVQGEIFNLSLINPQNQVISSYLKQSNSSGMIDFSFIPTQNGTFQINLQKTESYNYSSFSKNHSIFINSLPNSTIAYGETSLFTGITEWKPFNMPMIALIIKVNSTANINVSMLATFNNQTLNISDFYPIFINQFLNISIDNTSVFEWICIKFTYSNFILPNFNLTWSKLRIAHYNESIFQWELLSDWSIDAANEYIIANSSHLSYFAPLGIVANGTIPSGGGDKIDPGDPSYIFNNSLNFELNTPVFVFNFLNPSISFNLKNSLGHNLQASEINISATMNGRVVDVVYNPSTGQFEINGNNMLDYFVISSTIIISVEYGGEIYTFNQYVFKFTSLIPLIVAGIIISIGSVFAIRTRRRERRQSQKQIEKNMLKLVKRFDIAEDETEEKKKEELIKKKKELSSKIVEHLKNQKLELASQELDLMIEFCEAQQDREGYIAAIRTKKSINSQINYIKQRGQVKGKVVFLGRSLTSKTSILYRYKKIDLDATDETVIEEIRIMKRTLGEMDYELIIDDMFITIMDTGGQDKYLEQVKSYGDMFWGDVKVIVWFVDSHDPDHLNDSLSKFLDFKKQKLPKNAKIIIALSKYDDINVETGNKIQIRKIEPDKVQEKFDIPAADIVRVTIFNPNTVENLFTAIKDRFHEKVTLYPIEKLSFVKFTSKGSKEVGFPPELHNEELASGFWQEHPRDKLPTILLKRDVIINNKKYVALSVKIGTHLEGEGVRAFEHRRHESICQHQIVMVIYFEPEKFEKFKLGEQIISTKLQQIGQGILILIEKAEAEQFPDFEELDNSITNLLKESYDSLTKGKKAKVKHKLTKEEKKALEKGEAEEITQLKYLAKESEKKKQYGLALQLYNDYIAKAEESGLLVDEEKINKKVDQLKEKIDELEREFDLSQLW
ncbi:MAG: hypothetical protein EAX96_06125 [Candidatus Lokiarchaeota archaeon]|nr:hypothetical protein [Candidatus Lokiarchaeota archaeon]